MDLGSYTTGQKIALGGAGIAIAGAFLPWVSVEVFGSSASVNGIDRDGIFTPLMGVIIVGAIVNNPTLLALPRSLRVGLSGSTTRFAGTPMFP